MIGKEWLLLICICGLFSCRPPKELVSEQEEASARPEESVYPEQEVRQKIDSLFENRAFAFNDRVSLQNIEIKEIYRQNDYHALWKSKDLARQGTALINRSIFHGLNPSDYNFDLIDSLVKKAWVNGKDPLELAYADILLTSGIIRLTTHLSHGKCRSETYHPSWENGNANFDGSGSILIQLIHEGKIDSIEKYFQPKSLGYAAMYAEFVRLWLLKHYCFDYKKLEYPGKLMQVGDTSHFVQDLKAAMVGRGFLKDSAEGPVFNTCLEIAVKQFQLKHGLNPDGVPGPKTYFFLNWSIDDYLVILRVNMERQRWGNNTLPGTRIQVNIPSADLKLYQGDSIVFSSKVIVGKYDNQTPVLTSEIEYLVFNPCWTVPQSIATKKFLKRMQRDTTFLDKRNMFITQKGSEVDHDTIDFKQYTEQNFPFKIYQRSSNDNALGKVKFMFPNSYSIYLHDTPGKSLFERDSRFYSHGCVRVQSAERLAEFILHGIDKNTKPIDYYYKKGFPVKVYLKEEIPLSVDYYTCRYNEKLYHLQYFKDIYNFDGKLLSDLQKR